jgi:hypothetical protein
MNTPQLGLGVFAVCLIPYINSARGSVRLASPSYLSIAGRPATMAATVLPRKPPFADDALSNDDSDGESVAESCPWPQQPRPATAPGPIDDSCSSSTCCHDDDDDDGCSSCVEGDECGYYDDEGGMRNKAAGSVWWERLAVARTGSGGAFSPLPPAAAKKQEEEDPKRAAERQEEDRKFWEDCLATGYP